MASRRRTTDRSVCDVALSRIETTILTPNGHVLVCRDRDSRFMDHGHSVMLKEIVIEKGLCVQLQDPGGFCCSADVSSRAGGGYASRGGLLGGSPAAEDTRRNELEILQVHDEVDEEEDVPKENQSMEEDEDDIDPADNLTIIPSFDYSHYDTAFAADRKARGPLAKMPENGEEKEDVATTLSKLFNSFMSSDPPEQTNTLGRSIVIMQNREVTPDSLAPPTVMHGVPTCLPGLSEIRVTHISAHPLGSHVLLISSDALLFSYGLNDCGQLGLGIADTFVKTPTLMTAILEGGGKTVSCAAGIDNSLIVVRTDDRRVRTLRNKAGLQAIAMQRVTSSPSRLEQGKEDSSQDSFDEIRMCHHQVYGFGANNSSKLGLLDPPQVENARVSLPHRVALHAKVWPEEQPENLPPAGIFQVATSNSHSAALVRRATGSIELYTWGESRYGALGDPASFDDMAIPTKVVGLSYSPELSTEEDTISHLMENEYPAKLSLGPLCTFVITNTGRCLSFGTNEDGLLGLGKAEAIKPTAINFSDDRMISSISMGARHAIATSATGNVYTWGMDPASYKIVSIPERLDFAPTVKAVAGFDSSAFIPKSGILHTSGLKSGRLGQGEVPPNPRRPCPLFGGLRLWREEEAAADI